MARLAPSKVPPMNDMPTSPFLPGTKIQYAWDSTSLGYIKTCPRLYYYHMIEGWQPREESIHLRFGIEYHKALDHFDQLRAEGKQFDDALRETVRGVLISAHDWDPDPQLPAYTNKNHDSLLHLVVAYCDTFRDDPCETVILENGKPAVELSFRFELDWGPMNDINTPTGHHETQPYILCGHLDRLVNFAGAIFVLDHKTTSKAPTDYYFNQYTPNNQMTIYSFAGKVILEAPIAGVIVEAAQIAKDKPVRFERRPTYRSDEAIDEWLTDLEYHLLNAEHYATQGHWPMNDTACDKYGGCRFREVCARSPAVRQRILEADFEQKPEAERWNPLRSR